MSIEAVKIKVYFCVVKVHTCFKKIISRKKTIFLIKNLCLLGFVCRSINLQIFWHQSPDFRCFEVERSEIVLTDYSFYHFR